MVLETGALTLKTPVLKFSEGFRHDSVSAKLPACTIEGPAKLCPRTRTWIPRTTPDPTPAVVEAQYARPIWPWWG
eukprot:7385131-Prymnesium_polylepis.1